MIRLLILLLFSIMIGSYSGQSTMYEVKKIRTVGNYYVIYVCANGDNYKIASKKESNQHCEKIKKRERYAFDITEITALGGPEVDCFSFDAKTVICKEPDFKLVLAKNLIGLCLQD